MTMLGTMKVVDIQDKQGYSLVTFEIPDDCKQFLIEHAMRDLLTKAAEETKAKFGSVLPEPIDNQTSQVYNEDSAGSADEADDAGWITNKGVQPVGDDVPVDVLTLDGALTTNGLADYFLWDLVNHCESVTHWRLSKTKQGE